MNERTVDLTNEEWELLGQLPLSAASVEAKGCHKMKLLKLDLAAEKAGNLVTTFEGRLMLRQHHTAAAAKAR